MVPSVEVIVEEDNATRRHTGDDASTQKKQKRDAFEKTTYTEDQFVV